MNAMTEQSAGLPVVTSWQEPVHMPPMLFRDSERRDYCAPAWMDQVAAVLELQEAIRIVKHDRNWDWAD